jgi:hypothetical protein
VPGDFRNAALTLRGNATPARGKASITALGSATIAGSLADSAWAVDMDAGAVTVAGAVSGRTLAGAPDGDLVDLLSVKSLTLGEVADGSVTVGGVLGAVKALSWATGTIEADKLASLAITGRKGTATAGLVFGDFGAAVVLHVANPSASTPAAGTVAIAHDLNASLWKVTGALTTFTVTGTARNSTVRASGSIAAVTLGASNGSRFLAGVTSETLVPASVTLADLDPLASIGSLTIKGWAVTRGQTPPAFLADSQFLAPSMGTVSLLNCTAGSWSLFARAQAVGTDLRIKNISHKDTRDPTSRLKNWTWTSGKTVPAGDAGAMKPIT